MSSTSTGYEQAARMRAIISWQFNDVPPIIETQAGYFKTMFANIHSNLVFKSSDSDSFIRECVQQIDIELYFPD